MLGVGDGVADDVLQEDFEDTASLLVDETGDTLDTSTTCETTNGLQDNVAHVSGSPVERKVGATHGLGDTLDVVAQNLAVTLSTALSETLGMTTTTLSILPDAIMKRSERTFPPLPRPDMLLCCWVE